MSKKDSNTSAQLGKSLATAVTSLTRSLKTARANRPRTRRARRQRMGQPAARTGTLPGSYAANISARFNILSSTGGNMRVSGCDLVYTIPWSGTQESHEYINTVIPCNPAYWTGTRIAALASGYQNYRPLKFRIHYVPQVAVTQEGIVVFGTLWNQPPSMNGLQQSLLTSNGGMLTQVYVPATSDVKLGANLQQNLFRMGGQLDNFSNPFYVCASFLGPRIVPGWFYIEYEYELKNAIGESRHYKSFHGTAAVLKQGDLYTSVTVVLPNIFESETFRMEPGSILQFRRTDVSTWEFFYEGSKVFISDTAVLWWFLNGDKIPPPPAKPVDEWNYICDPKIQFKSDQQIPELSEPGIFKFIFFRFEDGHAKVYAPFCKRGPSNADVWITPTDLNTICSLLIAEYKQQIVFDVYVFMGGNCNGLKSTLLSIYASEICHNDTFTFYGFVGTLEGVGTIHDTPDPPPGKQPVSYCREIGPPPFSPDSYMFRSVLRHVDKITPDFLLPPPKPAGGFKFYDPRSEAEEESSSSSSSSSTEPDTGAGVPQTKFQELLRMKRDAYWAKGEQYTTAPSIPEMVFWFDHLPVEDQDLFLTKLAGAK